jgi:hypothetical protein
MTGKQKKRIALHKGIEAIMDQNQRHWHNVIELRKTVEQFKHNIARSEEHATILRTDLVPFKLKMLNAKKVLVERVFLVASVLRVFASDTGDRKLRKLTGMKFSEFQKLSVESLVKYSKKILKITGPLLEQKREEGKNKPRHLVADYGLGYQHLENLKKAIDGCEASAADFTSTRNKMKKSRVKLERCIRENDQLLKKKIDRMMHLYRDNQEAYYYAYIRARIPVKEAPVKEAPVKNAKKIPPENKPSSDAEKDAMKSKPAVKAEKAASARKKPPAVKKQDGPGPKPGK